jgi:hypothetical protein
MAKQTWESCIYTAEEERDFVKVIFRSNIKKMLDLETKNYRLGSGFEISEGKYNSDEHS